MTSSRARLLGVLGLTAACSTASLERDRPDAGPDAGVLQDAALRQDAGESRDAAQDAGLVPAALVHSALWEVSEGVGDPFSAEDAGQDDCSPAAYGEESLGGRLVFFVRTSGCAYITVQQASRTALRAGDRVELELLQFPLTAPLESAAHVVVRVGDATVFERQTAVPAEMQHFVETWVAPHDVAEGTQVYFHVHNHGMNEYALLGLTRLP